MNKNISKQKEHLLELRDSGQFLFHGSGKQIKTLEPRQSYHYPGTGTKIAEPHLAVFASSNPDIAIFMAIFSEKNFTHLRTGFGSDENGVATFRVNQETIQALPDNASGYVHVLSKDHFQHTEADEWISFIPTETIEIIEVTKEDLPKIKISEF